MCLQMDFCGEHVSTGWGCVSAEWVLLIVHNSLKPCVCAAKLVPVAYGIKKLQITCVVEDDKVGTDFLEESITFFEDYVRLC